MNGHLATEYSDQNKGAMIHTPNKLILRTYHKYFEA